jgi:hypothetical protein
MPDHMHGLLRLQRAGGRHDAQRQLPARTRIAAGASAIWHLLVSPFDDEIEAPSTRRAAWCNQYVLEHCNRLVIGHLNPGGMLACILSEADPEKEITYI